MMEIRPPVAQVWEQSAVRPVPAGRGFAAQIHGDSVVAGLRHGAVPSVANFRHDLRRGLTEGGDDITLQPSRRALLLGLIDQDLPDDVLAHHLCIGLVEHLAFGLEDPTMELKVVNLADHMASHISLEFPGARNFLADYLRATSKATNPVMERQAVCLTFSAEVFREKYPSLPEQSPWIRLNGASTIFPIDFFYTDGDRVTAIFPMPQAILTGAEVRYPGQGLKLAYCMGDNGEVPEVFWNDLHLLGYLPIGFPLRPAPIDKSRVRYHPAFFALSHDALFHLAQVFRGTTPEDRLLAAITVACCHRALGEGQRQKIGDWLNSLLDLSWRMPRKTSLAMTGNLVGERRPEDLLVVEPVRIEWAWHHTVREILETILHRITLPTEGLPYPHPADMRAALDLLDLLRREYSLHFPRLFPRIEVFLNKLRDEVEFQLTNELTYG